MAQIATKVSTIEKNMHDGFTGRNAKPDALNARLSEREA
jgi:hypothetical protein